MALKDSLRLESIYFNNLKSMMKMLKSWADGTTDEKTKDIIENCIQADAAILLLYRNLGEAWNELMANIQKEMHDLQDLKETVDAYHDELNEKIDEVNNYLMVLIRELQERVTILEQRVDVLETQINIILDLVEDEPVQAKRGKKNTKAANDPTYHLEYHGDEVSYSDIEDMIEEGLDRVIWVRAKEELCHFDLAETNIIKFNRTFYNETAEKIYKELVTINSSDVVTYSLFEVKQGGVIYLECSYDTETEESILTYNSEPITLTEIQNFINSGFIVKVILNSVDGVEHADLPVILSYIRTKSWVEVEEGHDINLTELVFENTSMNNDTSSYEDKFIPYFMRYLVSVFRATSEEEEPYETVKCKYYLYKGVDILLKSPVSFPSNYGDKVYMDNLCCMSMRDWFAPNSNAETNFQFGFSGYLTFRRDQTAQVPEHYAMAYLTYITPYQYDVVDDEGIYSCTLLFKDLTQLGTSYEDWEIHWTYNETTGEEVFYMGTGAN